MRAAERRPILLAAALAAALPLFVRLASPSAAAGEAAPDSRLRAVEKAIEGSRQDQTRYARQAASLENDLAGLRAASVKAAATAQEDERTIAGIESRLAGLTAAQTSATADLQQHRAADDQLLMALQLLARNPPEALALAPDGPVDALRSGLLLSAALPELRLEAEALRRRLAALATLRRETAEAHDRLVAEEALLTQQRGALQALMTRKAELERRARSGAELSEQRLAELSREATSLRDLMARLDAERQKQEAERQRAAAALEARAARRPPRPDGAAAAGVPSPEPQRPRGLRPFPTAYGALVMPVAGRLKRRFGEADEFGTPSKGIVLAARRGGEVVAPFDGRIEFAGPFRGYGQILIIQHGGGYHSLLAGLDRIDGTVGQWLVAGEPVGTMPAARGEADLYLELRRHDQPINPLPWLATRDDKVSG